MGDISRPTPHPGGPAKPAARPPEFFARRIPSAQSPVRRGEFPPPGRGGPNFGPLAVEPRPPTRFARRRNWGEFFTPGRLAPEGLWLALWSEISSRGAAP